MIRYADPLAQAEIDRLRAENARLREQVARVAELSGEITANPVTYSPAFVARQLRAALNGADL